jgi:hypothetical protein
MIFKATPLMRTADVERAVEWYKTHLGFEADPFPRRVIAGGNATVMERVS